jgi:hypothetical protein
MEVEQGNLSSVGIPTVTINLPPVMAPVPLFVVRAPLPFRIQENLVRASSPISRRLIGGRVPVPITVFGIAHLRCRTCHRAVFDYPLTHAGRARASQLSKPSWPQNPGTLLKP